MNIESILANKAQYLYKKPSKQSAIDLIVKMAEDENVSRDDLAKLYAYFIPNKPKNKKDDFSWVNSAINNKDFRRPLQCAYFTTDGDLVGTDGHVLHVVYNYSDEKVIEEGHYNVNKAKINDLGLFPNWKSIIGDTAKMKLLESAPSELVKDKVGYAYKISPEFGYNKKYLDNALSGFKNPDIYVNESYKMVIKGENKVAVVMPRKII